MPQGWIKLHRKLSKKAFYNKPNYLALWVHILLSANHEEKEFLWNGSIIKIKKGQFITGRKQLSEQSGIPETTVERLLTFFEKEQQIGQQKTSKYRLITIYKWHEYQIMDNKRTTSGQQADTNKNDNNDNKQLGDESPKDMSGFNRTSDDFLEEDIQVEPDYKPKEKKQRHYKEVYEIFKCVGIYSIDWIKNTTEQTAGDNLYTEKGLEQVEKALQLYKEYKDEEFCPLIYSPSSLMRKWKPLLAFKKKKENS